MEAAAERTGARNAAGVTGLAQPSAAAVADGIPGGVVPGGGCSVEEAQNTAEARVMRLRGYGNAIVPQVAAEFVMAWMGAQP
jgi:DNA (cytosine-5)-methyltransferase 1